MKITLDVSAQTAEVQFAHGDDYLGLAQYLVDLSTGGYFDALQNAILNCGIDGGDELHGKAIKIVEHANEKFTAVEQNRIMQTAIQLQQMGMGAAPIDGDNDEVPEDDSEFPLIDPTQALDQSGSF